MPIPVAQAGTEQTWPHSTLPKSVTLWGSATNTPILEWRWTMLYVPVGSVANIGVNTDFVDGVSTHQNPSFTCDVVGCYVLQLQARNVLGWNELTLDRELAQTPVYILTEEYGLRLPGAFLWRYDVDLNQTLMDLEAAISSGGTPPEFAPVNVTRAVAAAGVGTTSARHDHKHDIETAAPVSIGDSNQEGSSGALSKSDHVHKSGAFLQLPDAPHSYVGQSGKAVQVTSGEDGLEFVTPGSGVSTFIDLTDTPANYTGASGKLVSVEVAGTPTELVFSDPAGVDTTAFHTDAAGELSALDTKTGPLISTDLLLGEDSEDSFNKVKIPISALPSGSATFIDLTDTPANYTGASGKYVRVEVAEFPAALEFVDPPTGGGIDRLCVFSDDSEFSEPGATFVSVKSFRIVRDSDLAPVAWRFVVGLLVDDIADDAECRVVITNPATPGTPEITSTMTADGVAEEIVTLTHTIDTDNEPVDTPITIDIQLRRIGSTGTAATIKYTDVYAIYA